MEQREIDNMLLSMIQKHFPSLPLSDKHTDWRKWLGFARAAYAAGRASHASVPGGMELSAPTILPDGSGFGILSLPLPKDHWLYAEREYEESVIEPNDLPAPILTHSFRRQVIAAIRYAVRASTNCGKEENFDPDAMVRNAVYALCGPYNSTAPTPPVSEDRWLPIETAPKDGTEVLLWFPPREVAINGHYGEVSDGDWESGYGNWMEWLIADELWFQEDPSDAPTHWMPLPKAPEMEGE